jgi:UDP-N-acetylglucosamine 2-epimerase
VAAGTALVGARRERSSPRSRSSSFQSARAAMTQAHNPYGDGHAAEQIAAACERFLG